MLVQLAQLWSPRQLLRVSNLVEPQMQQDREQVFSAYDHVH